MLNPEKESLSLVKNTNRQIISVGIRNPQLFGLKNLKELVRYQISSFEEREIIISSRGKNMFIPPKTLSDTKRLPKNARAKMLKDIASAMYDADEVTIRIPFTDAKGNNQGLILEEFVVRKPQEQEMIMIVKNQSRQNNRIILAEWHAKNKVCATAAILPNNYRHDPQKLEEISQAIAGADKISILRIVF